MNENVAGALTEHTPTLEKLVRLATPGSVSTLLHIELPMQLECLPSPSKLG